MIESPSGVDGFKLVLHISQMVNGQQNIIIIPYQSRDMVK